MYQAYHMVLFIFLFKNKSIVVVNSVDLKETQILKIDFLNDHSTFTILK